MENFIDREQEMQFLNNEYHRRGSSLVVLYGRRRVGKTELSAAFMKDKNSLYFLVTEESELQNRNAFKDAVAEFCDNDLLKNAKVESWEILFRTLLSKTIDEKMILVIDEFQYIKAIAAGNQKLAKIAGILELKQTGLTKYLKTLIDLDILEREVPITEKNPEKSKRGLYKIKDNFILFWFKFIYPNLSFIESGNKELAMKKIKENLTDGHISYVYEDICIEKMWKLNAKKKWDFTFDKLGRWWNNDTEIHIVAFDSTGTDIIFGECKYWEGKVGVNILTELEQKSKAVAWKKEHREEHFILFAINGFTEELMEIATTRHNVMLCE